MRASVVALIAAAAVTPILGLPGIAQNCSGNGCDFIQVRKNSGCIVLRNTHQSSAIRVIAPMKGPSRFVYNVYSNSEEIAKNAFTGTCIKDWYSTGHEAILLSPPDQRQPQTPSQPPSSDPQFTRETTLERFGARIELTYNCHTAADVQVYYTDRDGVFRRAPLVAAEPYKAIKLDPSVRAKSEMIFVYGQIRGNGPPGSFAYEWAGDPSDPNTLELPYKNSIHPFRLLRSNYGGGSWLGFSLSCPGLESFPSFPDSGRMENSPSVVARGTSSPRRSPSGEPLGRPVDPGSSCRGRGC